MSIVIGRLTNYAATMPKKLSDLVRTARTRKGWTQEEAAEELGVSRSWIAQIETDRIERVQPDYVDVLEQKLGISREDLAEAMDLLGPLADREVINAIRRIAALPTIDERIEALQDLPPEVLVVIESAALALVQNLFRSPTPTKA